MAALIEALKYLLNGAKLKNWHRLIVIVIVLVLIFAGQFFTSGQIADAAKNNSVIQARETRRALLLIRSDIADLHTQVDESDMQDSIRTKRLERKIAQINNRVDEINENGADATNERIDNLIRTLKVRRQ